VLCSGSRVGCRSGGCAAAAGGEKAPRENAGDLLAHGRGGNDRAGHEVEPLARPDGLDLLQNEPEAAGLVAAGCENKQPEQEA